MVDDACVKRMADERVAWQAWDSGCRKVLSRGFLFSSVRHSKMEFAKLVNSGKALAGTQALDHFWSMLGTKEGGEGETTNRQQSPLVRRKLHRRVRFLDSCSREDFSVALERRA